MQHDTKSSQRAAKKKTDKMIQDLEYVKSLARQQQKAIQSKTTGEGLDIQFSKEGIQMDKYMKRCSISLCIREMK